MLRKISKSVKQVVCSTEYLLLHSFLFYYCPLEYKFRTFNQKGSYEAVVFNLGNVFIRLLL